MGRLVGKMVEAKNELKHMDSMRKKSGEKLVAFKKKLEHERVTLERTKEEVLRYSVS